MKKYFGNEIMRLIRTVCAVTGCGLTAAAAAAANEEWLPIPSTWTARGTVLPAAPAATKAVGDVSAVASGVPGQPLYTLSVSDSTKDTRLAGGRFVSLWESLKVPGGLWLKVAGGSYEAICGGHCTVRQGELPEKPLTEKSHIVLEGPRCVRLIGTASADDLTGGNCGLQEYAETEGDAFISVDGEAQIRGTIAGADIMVYGGSTHLRGDTSVRIGNVQRTAGCIAGSFAWGQAKRAHAFQTGNAQVEVVIPPRSPNSGAEPLVFAKSISGGPWMGAGLGEASLSGDASVTVDAPGVRFPEPICGGGQNDVKHPVFVRVGGNTSVTLKRGYFCGTVTAGGLPGYSMTEGRATLTLQGGDYTGAVLNAGQAGSSLLRIAAHTDLRPVTGIDGFEAVEMVSPLSLTMRAEHVRSGMVFRLNGGTLRVALSGSKAATRPYVFPATTEGEGQLLALFDDGHTIPLINGRVYLPDSHSPMALWTRTTGHGQLQGWSGTPGNKPPKSGDILLDISSLGDDTELTLPPGRFTTVRVLGNGRSSLTLRLADGASVERIFLYADARVRFVADTDTVLPFSVSGTGIFEKAGKGRVVLSKRLEVSAPGYVRIEAGTLAFSRGHTLNGNVWVASGAVLDFNGTPDGYTGTVQLEGGAVLANDSPTDIGVGHRQMTAIVLLGDASIRANGSFGLVAPDWSDTRLTLNGYTLRKTGPGAFRPVKAAIDTGGGSVDVCEGSLEFSGGGTETVISGDFSVRIAQGAGFLNPTGWLVYRGAVTFAPEGTLDVRGRLDGSGALRIASGTVRLQHTAPLRRGRITVDAGATLDLTAPGARALHEDRPNWGFGYIRGERGYVTVRGTLVTRPWHYNEALGGLAVEADRILLDGGTVRFAGEESFDESEDTRGFTVSERGAVLELPAGRSYTKRHAPKAGIDNHGTLTLRRFGRGAPARFVLHTDIAGTLEIGEGCSLAGNGNAENIHLHQDACLVSIPGQPVKTVTGTLTLPDRFDVRTAEAFTSLGTAPALLHLAPGAVTAGNLNCRIQLFSGDSPNPEPKAYRPVMRKRPDGGYDMIAVPIDVTLAAVNSDS